MTITEDITIPTRLSDTGAACDYLIKSSLTYIRSTLTIDPGVVIKVAQDGTLDAASDYSGGAAPNGSP